MLAAGDEDAVKEAGPHRQLPPVKRQHQRLRQRVRNNRVGCSPLRRQYRMKARAAEARRLRRRSQQVAVVADEDAEASAVRRLRLEPIS